MVQIAAARIKEEFFGEGNWKKELKANTKNIYRSFKKSIEVPSLAADFLQGCMKGQTKINLDLHVADDLSRLLRRLVPDMKPKLWGIPALGALGYISAFIIVMYVFLKHFFSKK